MPVTIVTPADGPSLGMPIMVARTATSKFSLPVGGDAQVLGMRLDVLGGGLDALAHHPLDRAERDDAAAALGGLHLEAQDAARARPPRPGRSPRRPAAGWAVSTCCLRSASGRVGHDHLARGEPFARPIFTGRYSPGAIRCSWLRTRCAAFAGQQQQFFQLVVGHLAMRVHQLEQPGERSS